MATFKTIVRYKRADGFYQVYIRVLHRSKSGYIKTDKFVTDKQLSKSGEIKDAVINKYCAQEILRYTELVNRKDVSGYSVTELIEGFIYLITLAYTKTIKYYYDICKYKKIN